MAASRHDGRHALHTGAGIAGGSVESSSVKRRLTCILAADAVGYSQHTSLDEEGTLRVLAAHRAVIDGIIAFRDGRIVSTAGDSVLAEFASPVEAVRCAVEMQEALKTRNDSLAEGQRLQFRVGVNLGDVVVKNGDLLGDGVNVAARLESIAEPGGVCISSSVFDQIAGKLNLGFQDIGEQSLKNISRPIRAYRLAGTGAPAPLIVSVTAKRPDRRGMWAAATLALAAVLGLATWKAGWLGGDGTRTVTVAAPAPAVVDDTKARAAADEAAAMRAKMEAEMQRARGDAEVMKRAAETELARARADADASRAARMKAEAEVTTTRARQEADATKSRAQAEADATTAHARQEADATKSRAQTEADAMKRDAETEVARAAQARKDAEAARAAVPVAATAPAAKAAPAAGANAWDGIWTVTRTCEKFQEVEAFIDVSLIAIRGGEMTFERGPRDKPGFVSLRGQVSDNGTVALTGTAISRASKSYGRSAPAALSGTLAGDSGELKGGWGGRRCTFAFARQ
ncbi:MAG: adenylate/guanylate cyclase domain-containing protein [Betaproteobacteria bacterium]